MLNFYHEQVVWFARYNPYILYSKKSIEPELCYIDDAFVCRGEILLVLRKLEDDGGLGEAIYATANNKTQCGPADIITKTRPEAVDLYNRAINSIISNYNSSLEYVISHLDSLLFYAEDLRSLPKIGTIVSMEDLVAGGRSRKYYYIGEEWHKHLKMTLPKIKETFLLGGGSYISPATDFVYFLGIHPDDYGTNIFSMFFPTIKDAYQVMQDHVKALQERLKNQIQHKIELLNRKKLV